MLLFTPELCPPGRDPIGPLVEALPHIDAIQVRIKPPQHPNGISPARELFEWTQRVLALAPPEVPVLVNDRVDVALALASAGCCGVHLGQSDTPPDTARDLLGPHALIGLSTHSTADVVRAQTAPIDYLGFGPVYPTTTKAYPHGLGPEAAWIAQTGSTFPLFPIGGITESNITELAPIGRAAVSSAILTAPHPPQTAEHLRTALG